MWLRLLTLILVVLVVFATYEYIERLVRTSFGEVVYKEGTHLLEVHYEPQHKLNLLADTHGGIR